MYKYYKNYSIELFHTTSFYKNENFIEDEKEEEEEERLHFLNHYNNTLQK